ncbi:MAG: hypothetical protein MUF04_11925 [Akkermansiaceae bacterium]|nr:hypothetical protein [Akkermansiaceae bacterium]
MKSRSARFLSLIALSATVVPLSAQTWTNSSANGLWSTAANWSTGVVPSATTTTASFTTPGTTGVRLDGADSRSCNITFGNGGTFVIGNESGDTARLIASGRSYTVSDANAYLINLTNGSSATEGTLEFGSASSLNVAAGGKLTLDGRYNGLAGAARTINKLGAGALELTGNHPDSSLVASFSAGTLVLNGTGSNYRLIGLNSVSAGCTLRFDSANANLLTGTTTLHTNTGIRGILGIVDLNGNSTATTRIQAPNIAGVVTNLGSSDATLTLGDFGATTGLAAAVTSPTYNGYLQDGPTHKLGLTLTGGSGNKLTLALGRTPTYTGPTAVTNGSTLVTPGLSNVSAVTVSSGATLRNTRSLNSSAAVMIDAGTLDVREGLAAPSLTISAGTLRFSTAGASDLNASTIAQTDGVIELDVIGNTADRLVATGNLSFSGTATLLAKLHAAPAAPVELASAGALAGTPVVSYSPALDTTRLANPSVSTAGNKVTLAVDGSAANLTWTGAVDEKWNLSTSNWNGGAGGSAFFNLDRVVFGVGPSNLGVVLDGTVVPSKVTINGGGTADYAFSGTGGIAGAGEGIQIDDSWVSLGGNNTFTGPVTLGNGAQLKLTSPQALGLTSGVTVNPGTLLDLNGQNLVGQGRHFSATIAGDGTGDGAITNTGASLFSATANSGLRDLSLSADASVGSATAAAAFDLGTNGSINGNGFKLTKKGTNEVIIGGPATNIEMVVESGTLGAIFDHAFGSTLRVKSGATARFTANTSVQSCNVIVESGGTLGAFTGNGTFTGTFAADGDVTINIPNTSAVSVNFTQLVSVPGNLLRTGASGNGGASTFGAGLSVGGNLTINENALVTIGNGGPAPAFSVTGAVTMAGSIGATLAVNRSDAFDWTKEISGTGSLRNLGPGTMTVLANLTNTSGNAAVDAAGGDISIGNGGTTGSAVNATVAAGRTLTVNRSGDLTFTGVTNATAQGGTAARINLAPGAVLTNGPATNHNHIGNISLNNATWTTGDGTGSYNGENYQLNGDVTVTGTAPSTITRDPSRDNSNSGVALNGTRTFTVANVTGDAATDLVVATELESPDAGGGTLVKDGPGTMALSVVPSHAAGTTVNAGILVVPGLPTGVVTVAAGARLVASDTINGTVNCAGALAPVSGIGTLTIKSPVTLSGVLAIEVNASGNDLVDVFSSLDLTGSKIEVTSLAPGFTSGVIAIANEITGVPTASTGYSVAVQDGEVPGTQELVLTATGAPANEFSDWLAAYAPGQGADDDHDGDGVPNAVEYFMGETGSGFTPTPAPAGGKVTWAKDPTANASYFVQTSTTLAPTGEPGGWENVTDGVTDLGSSVEYELPDDAEKIFVRIKVVIP